MKNLHFYETTEIDQLAFPQEKRTVSLDEPALNFLTDFTYAEPAVIEFDICALEVKKMMLQSHTKMKFVVDHNEKLLGIVSLTELSDLALIKKTNKVNQRETIPVTEMMIPKHELMAFDYEELKSASINDVIGALKDSGQHHCLVLDRGTHKIRGIFSASELSKLLHVPINIKAPSSFYNLFVALAH